MPCPFFYPTERAPSASWAVPPRVPLGDEYAGLCHASAEPFTPDHSTLRNFCNCGYGRGCCACFPSDAKYDAVRFHRIDSTRVQFIYEKDGWPVEHGLVDKSSAAILKRQAEEFLAAYARRGTEPE